MTAARHCNPSVYFVMITGYACIDSAVRPVREGAYDYLAKPFAPQPARSRAAANQGPHGSRRRESRALTAGCRTRISRVGFAQKEARKARRAMVLLSRESRLAPPVSTHCASSLRRNSVGVQLQEIRGATPGDCNSVQLGRAAGAAAQLPVSAASRPRRRRLGSGDARIHVVATRRS